MLPALRDSERRLLIHVALMLTCGPLSLLPLTAESSSTPTVETAAIRSTPPAGAEAELPPIANIALVRDPFLPADSSASRPQEMAGQADRNIVASLPPNDGASEDAVVDRFGTNTAPVVRAVILGARSEALVDISGEVRVLGKGDNLGLSTISSVDNRGVLLTNGERIPLLERRR